MRAGDPIDPVARLAPLLEAAQQKLLDELERREPEARFSRRDHPAERGGVHRPRVLEGGVQIERAAVHVSVARGAALPAEASRRRPALAGLPYRAAALSAIVHPRNPYAPTAHLNVRAFLVEGRDGTVCWFGGGFDLTPHYGFEEDCIHWHRTAKEALDRIDPSLYPLFKEECDRYFFLPHRGEARGVGGVFYDDFARNEPDLGLRVTEAVLEAFPRAYLPILDRRLGTPWGPRERRFQCWRRGRYVEFNLLHDRGTRFGLAAGARATSILASLPPEAHWNESFPIEPGSPEERLLREFLAPRDWLGG